MALPSFASLGLTPMVQECIPFETTTPVQAATIPLFMQNKDVIVEAVTGSGKTLAFALPIIEKLLACNPPLKAREIGAIVIAPTRELAAQIHQVICQLISSIASTSSSPVLALPLLLTGGTTTIKEDVAKFLDDKPTILIGTPGRLEEFLLGSSSIETHKSSKAKRTKPLVSPANVKRLELLVLDEADRLLDLGFAPILTKILQYLPKQRRTGLFSATMTDALSQLVRLGLRNPVRVVVKNQSRPATKIVNVVSSAQRTPSSLTNGYVLCHERQKIAQLIRHLQYEAKECSLHKFIVYFSTCAAVDYFYKVLPSLAAMKDFNITSLHGKQVPARRAATFSSFSALTENQLGVLLCTDVAARGLDLPDVDCVIQVDAPQDTKVFSHRCGRTARAGRKGKAITLLLEGREEEYVEFLKLRDIPLERLSYLQENGEPSALVPASDTAADDLCLQLRQIALRDRDIHEKATKAFVSFVRSYSKHEAAYIFRLQSLDLAGVAMSYGLLRLPAMPEIKRQDLSEWKDIEVDWDQYAYVDSEREKKRLETLKTNASITKLKKHEKRPPRTEAWSKKAEKKRKAEERSAKRASASNTSKNKDEPSRPSDNEEGIEVSGSSSEGEGLAKVKRRKVMPSSGMDTGFAFDA